MTYPDDDKTVVFNTVYVQTHFGLKEEMYFSLVVSLLDGNNWLTSIILSLI